MDPVTDFRRVVVHESDRLVLRMTAILDIADDQLTGITSAEDQDPLARAAVRGLGEHPARQPPPAEQERQHDGVDDERSKCG